MQDFRNYDFTLTVKDIEKLVNDGLEVVVIVNGEYYDIVSGSQESQIYDSETDDIF